MTQNYHLLSSEQNALQVSEYVQDYSTNVLEMQLGKHPLPIDVEQVASDLITDLAHFVSVQGADVPDVLSKAFQNYLEEISGGDAPEETIDRFKSFIDAAIYEATIGTALSTPAPLDGANGPVVTFVNETNAALKKDI